MELLERTGFLETLAERLAAARDGYGTLVLVGGEAGVGKTALVRRFCEDHDGLRILVGACEPLFTARPLGPLADIAAATGGELEQLVERGARPHEVAAALGRELAGAAPTIVVLEDLHWADEATLDVVRLLGRRVEPLRALVLATFRDDELDTVRPLRIVLGELASAPAVKRLQLRPLSAEAVAELADEGIDAGELHLRTGGNPFFVTEVLAAPGGGIPATVRDAVLARTSRLDDDARELLDAVSVVPQRVELRLLEAVGDPKGLDACLASGILRAEPDAVAFRHELARLAVETEIPPHRRVALHRAVLAALADVAPDPSRLAHHAEAAGDAEAVLRHAPEAGERAAALGAHRESAAQFARALRFADGLAAAQRAALLERRSYECYLTGQVEEAATARRAALELHRALGDRLREGDAQRWLSRLLWFLCRNAEAEEAADEAVRLLEPLPPGPELAMAYSNLAQLRMLAFDGPGADEWGGRAIALAERLGETEILVHALNNVGTARYVDTSPASRELLERAAVLAREHGLEEHVARASCNLAAASVVLHDYPFADHHLAEGIDYCIEHDLGAWRYYLEAWRARSELDQGRWDDAAATATRMLRSQAPSPGRIPALIALALVRARRGDPEVWPVLDEALALARTTGEVQRLCPVAAARAEAALLAGEPERVRDETEHALELARPTTGARFVAELAVWRRRAGIEEDAPPTAAHDPYTLELAGERRAAAERWRALGCPYESALALADGEPDELADALDALRELGAAPAAALVARRLRERGVRGIARGPRASTAANPGGLTARELEVLALVVEGLRNAEIAARLFLSVKTVDHHVSAILRKLDARSRVEAVAAAERLGIGARA